MSVRLDPEKIRTLFFWGQLLAGAIVVWALLKFFRSEEDSAFRLRESERLKGRKTGSRAPGMESLADARMKSKPRAAPLQLEGIRLDGAPHEILGVSAQATAPEIQKAYRDLMKRYHPDRVGSPGTREWTDAQRIAEAINNAKEQLLKGRK